MNKEYLEDFKMRFTYNTNAIEGSTVTLPETVSIIKDEYIPNGKKVRDVYEVINHAMVFDEIIETKDDQLDVYFIKMVHGKLMDRLLYDRGSFKTNDNYILGADFQTAPASTIELTMKEYVDNLNWQLENRDDIFEVLAESHIKFERIHPFSDGNGRVGRLLINKILLSRDMEPVNIQNDDKSNYYQMLANQDVKGLSALFEELHMSEKIRHQSFKLKRMQQVENEYE